MKHTKIQKKGRNMQITDKHAGHRKDEKRPTLKEN